MLQCPTRKAVQHSVQRGRALLDLMMLPRRVCKHLAHVNLETGKQAAAASQVDPAQDLPCFRGAVAG